MLSCRSAAVHAARAGALGSIGSRTANDNDLAVMRRIDELFTAGRSSARGGWRRCCGRKGGRQPQAGAAADAADGYRRAGPKPRTTKPAPGHKIFPYLLRDLAIDRPNQVWAADITYVPIGRGFLYLVAIIDWASRAVLAWRLSNTMDVSFCVSALEEALARFGKPEIFNTDQGSQFTSAAFTGVLAAASVRISMDGRGRWMDNVFIERLWRSPNTRTSISRAMPMAARPEPVSALDHLLQLPATAPGARQPDPDGGVADGRHRLARRQGCGHDAALGQRWRVAHMPTAATATADFVSLRDSTDGTAGFQLRNAPSGPTDGVHFSRHSGGCLSYLARRPLAKTLFHSPQAPTEPNRARWEGGRFDLDRRQPPAPPKFPGSPRREAGEEGSEVRTPMAREDRRSYSTKTVTGTNATVVMTPRLILGL